MRFSRQGVIPDRDRVNNVALKELIEALPHGFISVGDVAYIKIEYLCPLFYGGQTKDLFPDNSNFYASQCHVGIEMAFG